MIRTYPKEEYQREYNILKSLIPEDVTNLLAQLDIKVAGGTLTSLFSNRDVNDIDLYFPSWESMEIFLAYMYDRGLLSGEYDLSVNTNGYKDVKRSFISFMELCDGKEIKDFVDPVTPAEATELLELPKSSHVENIGMTDKSIMFRTGMGPTIQCICFSFFSTTEEIFNKFDYTINMGAFNFSTQEWEFHKDFMKHLAQKVLVLNPETDYPIISMLRAAKYEARGYSIARREIMKLGVSASRLNISSWEDAKSHLSGMYGTNVEELFDEKIDFSFSALFDKLDMAGDKIISKIATEKDKGVENCDFALDPVSYFSALQRLRKNTGRNYFSTVYGVGSCDDVYIVDSKSGRKKIGLLEKYPYDILDSNLKLFLSEKDAKNIMDLKTSPHAIIKISLSSPCDLSFQNYRTCLVGVDGIGFVEELIDNTGEIS